jgi:flagellin-like protein
MRFRAARGPDRGQSELIGTVLLLGIVIIGAGAAVAFGTTALETARDDSRASSVEHAMTQFDSKAAMVALGSSNAQDMRLAASGDGTYGVNDDAGWIRVSHVNHSTNGNTAVLTNTTLGSVAYESDHATIAYQGGGVWRGTGNESRMISPPEFHYRGATLTLPIIAVNGSDSVAGSTSAGIAIRERSKPIFPNKTAPDYGNASYRNPVDTGNVTVTVHSDHYVAWADYFEERTAGTVSVDHAHRTATVTLMADRAGGDFDMPNEGNSVAIRGMEAGHQLTDFTVSIKVDRWNQLQWSFHGSDGNEEFELHVSRNGGGGNCGDVDEVDVGVYYYNGTTDRYQGWQNHSVNVTTDPDSDFTKDCSDETLTANFTGTTPIGYDAIETGGESKWYYGSEIDDRTIATNTTFDQHDEDTEDGRNGKYNLSDPEETAELGFLVSHYIALLGPDADLEVSDGPTNSDSVDESLSTGTIDYEQSGSSGFLTFLHVTENEIEVDLD